MKTLLYLGLFVFWSMTLIPLAQAQRHIPGRDAPDQKELPGGHRRAAARPQLTFEEAKKRYDESLSHPDFDHRAQGIQALADSRDGRALAILRDRYFSPKDPHPHVAYLYLIAGIAGLAFDETEHVDAWQDWAKKSKGPKGEEDLDSWLQYHAQRIACRHDRVDLTLAYIRNSFSNSYHRAAAIEALACERRAEVLPLIVELLADTTLMKPGMTRLLTIESCASSLLAMKGDTSEAFKLAAQAVINLLGEKATTERSKLVIARRLARLFDSDTIYLMPEPWLAKLAGTNGNGEKEKKSRYVTPEFLGAASTGKRIVFLIDLSDSMLHPLSDDERKAIKRVITGRRTSENPEAKNREADTRSALAAKLDWDKIKTRFDAAREALKLSLRCLTADMKFSVVAFGTEAGWLTSTTGLVDANKANVDRTISEINAIQIIPPNEFHPGGCLRGNTNIHGAFLRAFRSLEGGVYKREEEHVDVTAFAKGADSIFILSDGEATSDDFPEEGKPFDIPACDEEDDYEHEWKDREGHVYKARRQRHDGVKGMVVPYYGPYQYETYYVQDILRMNLLRKVEIHCIGIGEANYEALKEIADIGLGSFSRIGK